MSDQPTPPPKPKPGSLRDRIAAFEKPAGGPAPGPAPAPRPKPGGISWKPKVPSPPSSPSAADVPAPSERKLGGMSASDAKESIGKGGSLKERMAALQNRGGFGAPPPVAPKPALEKPKWKPPPVIAPVDKDEDDLPRGEPSKPPPTPSVQPAEDETAEEAANKESPPKADAEEQVENDEEEEERQRRAAIAARMARLGGARVGVAPVFGKPAVKRPEPKEETSPIASTQDESENIVAESTKDDVLVPPPPPTETATEERPPASSDVEPSPEHPITERKNSEAASLVSVDTESQSSRSPGSMPLPSAPRRAAPPRKKAAKPPTPATPILGEGTVESPATTPALESATVSDDAAGVTVEDQVKAEVGDREEEIGEVNKAKVEPSTTESEVPPKAVTTVPVIIKDLRDEHTIEPVPTSEPRKEDPKDNIIMESKTAETHKLETTSIDVGPLAHSTDLPVDADFEEELLAHDAPPEPESYREESLPSEPAVVAGVPEKTAVEEAATLPVQAEEDEDEEAEAARRKRVADKLAKMGGVNPFAPPQRKPSLSSEEPQLSPASPTIQKRTSLSRESVGSPPQPRRDSLHKSSMDSPTTLQGNISQAFSVPSPPPRKNSVESPVVEDASSRRKSQDDSHFGPGVASVETKGIPEETEEPSDIEELPEESERYHDGYGSNEGKSTVLKTEGGYVGEEQPEGLLSDKDNIEIPPPPLAIPPPPVPHVSTRPATRLEAPVDPALAIDPVPLPPRSLPQVPPHASTPPARTLPTPPRLIPQSNDAEEASESESENISGQRTRTLPVSQQPSDDEDDDSPRPIPPRLAPSEENTDNESAPLPVPHRRSSSQDENTRPAASYATSRPFRSIPAPPALSTPTSDVESDYDEVLPTRPRHRPTTPGTPPANEVPLFVPPPASEDLTKKPDPSPLRHSAYPPLGQPDSSPTPPEELSPTHLTPTLSVSDQEILDEEEGDPIDPAFHSPSVRASVAGLPSTSPPTQEPSADPEEDAEQTRRRTIAERMAKLGGIKFGAAPIPASISRPPPPAPRGENVETPGESDEGKVDPSEEEEERARKERIAAKLAGMGGMRIGMLPLGVGGLRPQQSHALKEESTPDPEPESELAVSTPALPTRALPPSRPPPPASQSQDSDVDLSNSQYSLSASEDGVKVEAEESELEEVSHEDAEEPEEIPPPIPSRPVRRGTFDDEPTQPPPIPTTRPPIPTSMPSRKSSILTTASTARKTSVDSTASQRRPSVPKPHSEYVMVEEPKGLAEDDEVPPPPPPHRPAGRAPPSRGAPPLPDPADSISSQWELPSIPTSSLEFGPDADLSLSWSEDPIGPPPSSPPPPPPPPHREADRRVSRAPPADRQLSSDDLIAVWGRVGVQICEVATSLFEKSKKSLVGDGTYSGFVHAVFSEVPNAAPASPGSYGYLVYAQTGGSVQKRASEIMPGDVVELLDAKLKGHKGIHTYNQSVGAGEPLVGVISEFEPKKSKIRVFQANQHVGQQTVEAISYRLEDLKSGTVKVFRVLEAE